PISPSRKTKCSGPACATISSADFARSQLLRLLYMAITIQPFLAPTYSEHMSLLQTHNSTSCRGVDTGHRERNQRNLAVWLGTSWTVCRDIDEVTKAFSRSGGNLHFCR